MDGRALLRRQQRNHRRLGLGRGATRLQALHAPERHQQGQRPDDHADVGRIAPIDPYTHAPTPVEPNVLATARDLEHHLDQVRQDARPRRARHDAHVEEAVERRGRRGQAEKAAIGLDVRDRDQRGPIRYELAVDLDLNRVQRSFAQTPRRGPVVREQPHVALPRMSADPLDCLLDSREQAEALV